MTRPPPLLPPSKLPGLTASSGDSILQIKVRLVGVSPMIWRRVLVAADTTLRELHGVLQVPMGWQGLHLFQFCLRAVRYGSSELSALSPDVSLATLRLRVGSRFRYEYDPWAYLRDVLQRLPTQLNSHLDELLPHRWLPPAAG